MAGERVLSLLLRAGDVIRVCHRHDFACGDCLSHWEMDAVVIEDPAPAGNKVAVKWADAARPVAGGPAVTGINLFRPGEHVLRIGRLAAARTA